MKPEAWVYMIRCQNGSLYTGWTNDLPARVQAHLGGKGAKYTKAFGAVGLAYAQPQPGKSEALKREAALKRLPKTEKEALCAAWAACGADRAFQVCAGQLRNGRLQGHQPLCPYPAGEVLRCDR